MRACEIAETTCEGGCNTKCFACGKPACRECSVIAAKYHRWANKRVFADCLEMHASEIAEGHLVIQPDFYVNVEQQPPSLWATRAGMWTVRGFGRREAATA